MTILPQMATVLRCDQTGWDSQLRELLKGRAEVELFHFDYDKHGKACEDMAKEYCMEMTLDRDPSKASVHFRKSA